MLRHNFDLKLFPRLMETDPITMPPRSHKHITVALAHKCLHLCEKFASNCIEFANHFALADRKFTHYRAQFKLQRERWKKMGK